MPATLEDFGFEVPQTQRTQSDVERKIDSIIPQTTIAKPHTEESSYDTEYICKLVAQDRYIFDTRGWPNGINREEFDRLWDFDFAVPEDGYFWNAGHFSYAIRVAKKHFKADKEEIWKAIEKHKAAQVKLMAEGWKHSFEWELRTAEAENRPEDVERWKGHAKKAWKCYNDCLRELGLPEQPVPAAIIKPT